MRQHSKWKNRSIALLCAIIIGLLLFLCLRPLGSCTQQFPAEKRQWCTDEGEYYFGALDIILVTEGVTSMKSIVAITINSTYNYDDPPIEVYGELYFWDDLWEYWGDLHFPTDSFSGVDPPLIPITYNDYSDTEDLMFESFSNTIEYLGGNVSVINFTISSNEQYVTVTQECHEAMPFFNPASEYITEGYFYGVEYELEAWIDSPPNQTLYVKWQIVSECNSGIPLFQSLILSGFDINYGWIQCGCYSLKTIATSFALTEV